MPVSLKVAIKFLKHNKLQTLAIILGISIGVSVQVFIGLLSSGLENTLIDKIAGNSPQVTIYSNKGSIANWQDKTSIITSMDKNVLAAAPTVTSNVFIKLGDASPFVQIRGFMPGDLNKLYHMKSKMYEGKIYDNSGQAIVGVDLKKKLNLKVGDSINIVTIGGKKSTLTVCGFFDLGSSTPNGSWIIANLADVQNLVGFKDKANSIEIAVKDLYNADLEGKKIDKLLHDNSLNVQNWKDQNKFLASAIVGEKICTLIIQFFVLLATVLSIINILGMSVIQKYKQIGILKAMGIKDRSASYTFFIQAFILGVIGTILGLVFTKMYIMGFNKYIVNPQGMPLVTIIISRKFILVSCIIDVAAATFAAIFPALKAYRLNPVEVIKNG